MNLWALFCQGSTALIITSLSIYLLPLIYIHYLSSTQNLKQKYNTNWALVTGSSSGIGRAIAIKLAQQGLNIILVALDDDKLNQTFAFMKETFPKLEIRKVGVDLCSSGNEYVTKIEGVTNDIDVGIVVNNAGFISMGFFKDLSSESHDNILNCNTRATVQITHFFYKRMIDSQKKGCLIFTSSSSWFLPAPFACLYGATKAFVSSFAISLAIEAEEHKIDVCLVHPCYTRTSLYDTTPKLDVLDFLDKFAWTSEDVADVVMKAAGRVVSIDLGWYSVVSRLINSFVELGFLARVITPFRNSMAPKDKQNVGRVKKG